MTTVRTGHGAGGSPPPPPSGDRPARRAPIGERIVGVVLVALSLLPASACHFAFTTGLPSYTERYRDYAAAEPCPAHSTAEKWEDCLRTVPLTVESTEVEKQKRGGYTAFLHGAPLGDEEVGFGDPGPLLERLRPGDRVTATVWRGDVVVIGKDGVRQSSSDEPRDDAQMVAAVSTLAGLLSALALGFGAVAVARGHRPGRWRSFGKPLLGTVVITCFAVGFLALGFGLPWWVVPIVAVSVVAYAAWLFHRRRTRREQPAR